MSSMASDSLQWRSFIPAGMNWCYNVKKYFLFGCACPFYYFQINNCICLYLQRKHGIRNLCAQNEHRAAFKMSFRGWKDSLRHEFISVLIHFLHSLKVSIPAGLTLLCVNGEHSDIGNITEDTHKQIQDGRESFFKNFRCCR